MAAHPSVPDATVGFHKLRQHGQYVPGRPGDHPYLGIKVHVYNIMVKV